MKESINSETFQEENADDLMLQLEPTKECNKTNSSIDQIINTYGYRINTWVNIFVFVSICLIDGLVMFYFNCLLIPIKSLYKLSNFEIEVISSILFIGVAFGSYISGFLSNCIGRIILLKVSSGAILVCYLTLAFFQNFIIFEISRIFLGIFCGILVPIGQNLLTEILPSRLRGFTILVAWVGWQVSVLILLFIMLGIMPNLEPEKLEIVLPLSSIIILVAFIFIVIFARESPRNLILEKKYKEAFDYLEMLSDNKIDLEVKNKIIEQTNYLNKEPSNVGEIFEKKYLPTTILLGFIWFIVSMIFYGVSIVAGLTIVKLKLKNNKMFTNESVIDNLITMMLINIPSNFVAGILVEFKFLGRKNPMIIGFIIAAFFFFLIFFFPSLFSFFLGVATSSANLPFLIISVYTSEIYSTRVRDYALGIMFFCTRIGGLISQFVFILCDDINLYLPYFLAAFLSIVGAILILCLPHETHSRELDSHFEQENKELEENKRD